MSLEGRNKGVWYGIAAYGLWGLFPLFFVLFDAVPPFEVVLHRTLWSLVVCLLTVAVLRSWRELAGLRSGRTLALLSVAALVLALNWGIYIYSVAIGQVVQASLGYYINPLVTVLLGVAVLRERLRSLQWWAVGFGTLAVVVLTVDYGAVPWISLSLAVSFGLYGLIKKTVGDQLSALASLTGETLALAPLAAGALVWIEVTGRGHFGGNPPWQGLLFALCGVVTVIPLLLFAASARRVPLSTLGLLQYLTPTLQLLVAVFLLGEQMPISRWVGFGVVWVALALLASDSLRSSRSRGRTPEAMQAPEALADA